MEQNSSLASKAPKIRKEDCLIEWSKQAADVHNFIRGFSPEPGAYTSLNGKMLKIFRTHLTVVSSETQMPEQSKLESGQLLVSCADDSLRFWSCN